MKENVLGIRKSGTVYKDIYQNKEFFQLLHTENALKLAPAYISKSIKPSSAVPGHLANTVRMIPRILFRHSRARTYFRGVRDKSNLLNLRYNSSNVFNIASMSTLPPDSPMNVFDRNAKLLHRERAARDPDVKVYDYIKDEIGDRLSDRIFDIKRKFTRALNLGCGRGHVSKRILSESVEELVLSDMCPSFLNQAETTEDVRVIKEVVDEENPSFEPNSFDIVISSLSLHWVNDLPGCFRSINNSLKNDGVFLAAIFGGDTLYELR